MPLTSKKKTTTTRRNSKMASDSPHVGKTEARRNLNPLVILVLLSHAIFPTRCELFTALVDLRRLLVSERRAGDALHEYLAREARRLDRYEELHRRLVCLEEQETSVNRYILTTELARSWTSTIQDAFRESLKNARALRLQKRLSWPTEEDLTGAAVGLCRLQHTYQLSVAQMADLKSPSLNASAHDRMEVAARCFKSGDVKSAVGWWTSSLDVLEEEEQPTEDWENILRSLMKTTLRFRNRTNIFNLLSAYDFGASKEERARLVDLAQKDPQLEHSPVGDDAASFSQLCDSEFPSAGHLRCKLATNDNHPLLLLQPLKLEVLSEDPRIVLVHDFVGARERRMIRELAYPVLYRATVHMNAGQAPSAYRISKAAWLSDQHHPVVERLSRRIATATGLSTSSAEHLQVVNYGVGGHYSPHFDFSAKDKPIRGWEAFAGQRQATWLVYLSSVERGGATLFKRLRVRVQPEAGMALFWHNLPPKSSNSLPSCCKHRSVGDERTEHGACPVLVGSKWIATKWIHEAGQARIRYDWPG